MRTKTTLGQAGEISLRDESGTWQQAAKKQGKGFAEWITGTLHDAAFLINEAEQIENIRNNRAYEKAKRGEMMSLDELERWQKWEAKIAGKGAGV